MNRMLAIRQEAGLKAAYQVGKKGLNKWNKQPTADKVVEPVKPVKSTRRKLL